MRFVLRTFWTAAVLAAATLSMANAQKLSPHLSYMKLLFCAYGSIGFQPAVLPPNFENQFAAAVVEVNSEWDFKRAPLPTVTVFDSIGNAIKTKRVVSVEVFSEPYVRGEGNAAFYLNTDPHGHTQPWDGTLSAGMMQLRTRVALATQKDVSAIGGRCRVDLGPIHVEGPVDAAWPT